MVSLYGLEGAGFTVMGGGLGLREGRAWLPLLPPTHCFHLGIIIDVGSREPMIPQTLNSSLGLGPYKNWFRLVLQTLCRD